MIVWWYLLKIWCKNVCRCEFFSRRPTNYHKNGVAYQLWLLEILIVGHRWFQIFQFTFHIVHMLCSLLDAFSIFFSECYVSVFNFVAGELFLLTCRHFCCNFLYCTWFLLLDFYLHLFLNSLKLLQLDVQQHDRKKISGQMCPPDYPGFKNKSNHAARFASGSYPFILSHGISSA